MRVFIFIFLTINAHYFSAQQGVKKLDQLIHHWHKAASDAQFDSYFKYLSDDFIFLGTAPGERWTKKEFQEFSKPYFDKGKAWNFKSLERHVYFDKDKKIAWFDELLDTQMKICRGSGVVVKVRNEWKIQHYVLSISIPNDNSDAVVKIKSPIEDSLIKKLKGN